MGIDIILSSVYNLCIDKGDNNMKKLKMLDGGNLFVTRVRVVVHEEDNELGLGMETGHYNQLGYRLFYKLNDNEYLDILSNRTYPVINGGLKEHELFIQDPKPFWVYAHSLRVKERPEDVKLYADYVSLYFNQNMHNEKKWYAAKDFVHKVHHRNDEVIFGK